MSEELRTGEHEDQAEAIRRSVEMRINAEAAAYPDGSKNNGKIPSRYVEECMAANELGDGLLYASLLKDRLIYNATSSEWMRWLGHHWKRDIHDGALASVENVVDRLLEETSHITEQINWSIKKKEDDIKARLERYKDRIYKRISRLRTDRGRNACLKFARSCNDPLTIEGGDFDLHPWLLGCANGVIDLRSGKFRDGRPEDYISLSSPIEWKGIDEPAPEWQAFLLEIFEDDKDLVSYIQRLFGYGITGLSSEHVLPVFWGQGRNGKGVMVEVITHVLGHLSGSIQSELLLDQKRPRSSAGPSPDIMGLKGLRLAFASETDDGQKFSAAKVKWLTGGDQLVGRNPHDKYETRFKPTHTLFLLTNNKPHAAGDDFAFWERLHLVPFRLSFVSRDTVIENERPAKKGLAEDLKKEDSGILAWLVRGCLQYQKDGLNPPDVVKKATAEYRRDEDLLGEFIEDHCYLDPHAKTKASDLYDKFAEWFEANISKNVIKQKRFGTMMTRRFEKAKSIGVVVYKGIGLKYEGGSSPTGGQMSIDEE